MTHRPRHSGGTPGASGPPGRNYSVPKSSPAPPGEKGGGGYVAPLVPKIKPKIKPKPKPDTNNKSNSIIPKIKPKPIDKDTGTSRKISAPRERKKISSNIYNTSAIYSRAPKIVTDENKYLLDIEKYNLNDPTSLMSNTTSNTYVEVPLETIFLNSNSNPEIKNNIVNSVNSIAENSLSPTAYKIVASSLAVANIGLVEKEFKINLNDSSNITAIWKDGVSLMYNLEF